MQTTCIMILGFLGKDGSGKSSVSTQMALWLQAQGKSVLAIDADHNMDLSYNLGYEGAGPYIGGSFLPLREELGLVGHEPTEGLFTGPVPTHRFSFSTPDPYSAQYVHPLADNLSLMLSGPQHDQVLYGAHCSHSLAAPLKIYLPLLDLAQNEVVVVDEKASVDAVSTGIPTGFDVAIVVAEPRPHSLRVAKQILELLTWYDVPAITVLNKMQSDSDWTMFAGALGVEPAASLPFASGIADGLLSTGQFDQLYAAAQTAQSQTTRLDRTINKYKRNTEFQATQPA